jgi:hypothetical protein
MILDMTTKTVAVLMSLVGLLTPPPPLEQTLTGAGGGVDRHENEFKGDYLWFRFDAHGYYTSSTGVFEVRHYSKKTHQLVAAFDGRLSCLLASGPMATATGEITHVRVGPQQPGLRISFSVLTGQPARVGFFTEDTGPKVSDCQSIAPFQIIDNGSFRVDAKGQ